MKKIYLLTLITAALAFTACTVEKRHYMKGYYVSWKHTPHSNEQKNDTPAAIAVTSATTEENAPVETITNQNSAVVVAPPANEPQQYVISNANAAQPDLTVPTVKKVRTVKKNVSDVNVKKFIQKRSTSTDQPSSGDPDKVLLVILAILLPPVAMWLYEGEWNGRCWLNLLLTLLCGLPGMIHALIVIIGEK